MERLNDPKKRFYDALKDLFIGAKIEGESGYINLMKIKAKYFDIVFSQLKKEIDEKIKEFPEFEEELYDKLYSFFKRYFSESGSIYFVSTPISEGIYEKIYTDKEDVILFWKTNMLYYVKTDRLFKSMKIELNGFKFFFDISKLEYKKAWEKREIVYELKDIESDGTISFYVFYSERGRKTNIESIIKELKTKGIKIDEETLEKAFKIFEKQSEVDYFINKNAKQFLKEQFDLWLYQYVYSNEMDFSEKRIKQLKILKEIAYKIIDFIAQFEEELVKIWNKPKFILNSNYVITLDRIAKKGEKGIKLIEKIINHPGFEYQVKEWKELGIIEDFDKNKLFIRTLNGKSLNKDYQFLPIDTRYFDEEIKYELLSLFDNLDQELDGWLIKSENYQALITILPKFKEKVQTIYIDPPFNKE
ncbi:MAG: site-specific DNA-methyltransferase, partial [Candidatus Aenigmatarchaeota archaeon]